MSPSASLNIGARSLRSTPKPECSRGSGAPSPNAGSNRPFDSRSIEAISFATSTGLRPGKTMTLMPNFSFFVRPAAKAMAEPGSGALPLMRSLNQSESNFNRSRSSMKRAYASPSPGMP